MVHVPDADPDAGRPRGAARAGAPDGVAHHVPERPADRGRRREPVAGGRAGTGAGDRAGLPRAPGRPAAGGPARRPPTVLNAGEQGRDARRRGCACAHAPRCSRSPSGSASPIVKTLPGKAAVPDDHPLTTGGIGLLGTATVGRRRWTSATRCSWSGTNFPYTKHLPRAGQVRVVQIEVDPTIGPATAMPTEVPVDRRRRTSRCGALAPAARRARPTAASSSTRRRAMASGATAMAALEDADRDPIEPQYLMRLDRPATRPTTRSSSSRLGHDRDVGGAALRHPRRPPVLPARATSRRWRPGLPYAHRGAVRLSRTAVHRVRRRRRLRDADGRVRHRVPPRAADQGVHQQQRVATARSSGSRWCSAIPSSACASRSDSRLRAVGRGVRRVGHPRSTKSASSKLRSRRRRSRIPGRRSSTCTSTRRAADARQGHATSRPRSFAERVPARASRTRRRSRRRSSATRSRSCGRETPRRDG